MLHGLFRQNRGQTASESPQRLTCHSKSELHGLDFFSNDSLLAGRLCWRWEEEDYRRPKLSDIACTRARPTTKGSPNHSTTTSPHHLSNDCQKFRAGPLQSSKFPQPLRSLTTRTSPLPKIVFEGMVILKIPLKVKLTCALLRF